LREERDASIAIANNCERLKKKKSRKRRELKIPMLIAIVVINMKYQKNNK